MSRKRHVAPAESVSPADPRPQSPVNVVIVVESGRRPRPSHGEAKDSGGRPLLKAARGFAAAKRLVRRRKRPLSKRVKKAVRKGRRQVKRTARRVRRAMR